MICNIKLFFMLIPLPPISTLFPYTTLFRSFFPRVIGGIDPARPDPGQFSGIRAERLSQDRKSTRLNSSHVETSYAVFCLKKKTFGSVTQADNAFAPSMQSVLFTVYAALKVH